MTYRYQLYKCPICGTVTEIVHDGVSAMICCGKTMEVLDDREPVGTKESHMPVVEATEKGCKVSVGSKLHGMDADHLIEWAEIRTSDDTVLRKYFKAGETPVVEIILRYFDLSSPSFHGMGGFSISADDIRVDGRWIGQG